jgi:hypothetical protein
MNNMFSVLLTAALMGGVIVAIQLTLLAFRNPMRPRWLRGTPAETWATVGMIMSFSVVFGYLMQGLVMAGIPVAAAVVGVPLYVLALSFVLWRLIGGRERLRRAEAGQSPFGDGVAEPAVANQA